jgi:hypothetical protein
MTTALDHTLNAFRYYLPKVVTRGVLATLKTVTAQFPALLTSEFIVETMLQPEDDYVDFAMYVNRPESRDLLGTYVPVAGASADCEAAWAKVRAFVARWNSDPTLSEAVPQVCLTFDLDLEGGIFPNVHVRFESKLQTPETAIPLAQTVLSCFYDATTCEALMNTVHTVYENLPEGAYVNWIGSMIGRPNLPLKMTVRHVSPALLGGYLDAIGYHGPVADMIATAERLTPLVDTNALSIDGTLEGLGPKLGVEYTVLPPRSLLRTNWEPLLDAMVEAGWCTTERRNMLIDWIGYYHEPLEHMPVPQNLYKTLSHCKVIYEAQVDPRVKAYIYLGHDAVKMPRPTAVATTTATTVDAV